MYMNTIIQHVCTIKMKKTNLYNAHGGKPCLKYWHCSKFSNENKPRNIEKTQSESDHHNLSSNQIEY